MDNEIIITYEDTLNMLDSILEKSVLNINCRFVRKEYFAC